MENEIEPKADASSITITEEQIEASILDEQYKRFPGTTVTVCCLTLNNGFSVVGHSACVDPQNFSVEIGRKIARDRAFQQCWEFMGFGLAEKMAEKLERSRVL